MIIQLYLYVALAIENKKNSVIHNYKPGINCAKWIEVYKKTKNQNFVFHQIQTELEEA